MFVRSGGYGGPLPVRLGVLAAGLAACGLTFAGPAGAAAAPAPERAPACQGVHLLSGPLIVSGVSDPLHGTVIEERDEPPDDLVTCQPIDLSVGARASAGDRCEGAQVSATKLRRREAAGAVGCLIDEIRRSGGLNALGPQGELKRAARAHNGRMLDAGCFSHQCSGEPDLVQRVTSAGYLPCSCTWTVGENLAWGVRQRSSPAAIVDAWMHSPAHREMILRPGLEDIGVGVIAGRPGASTAQGATYTADFGVKD